MHQIGHYLLYYVENWTISQPKSIDFIELGTYFLPTPLETLESIFSATLEKCVKKCYSWVEKEMLLLKYLDL